MKYKLIKQFKGQLWQKPEEHKKLRDYLKEYGVHSRTAIQETKGISEEGLEVKVILGCTWFGKLRKTGSQINVTISTPYSNELRDDTELQKKATDLLKVMADYNPYK